MGLTTCTEPQCLYKGDLYLYFYMPFYFFIFRFIFIFIKSYVLLIYC